MKNTFTVKELNPTHLQSRSRHYVGKDGNLCFGNEPELLYIDLFCGAGGVSTGIVRAGGKVLMCINHDPVAIASHEANHPEVIHSAEDITTFDLTELVGMVDRIRQENPNAIICLWASLECTHFSKAKGGDHRDGDSRTLAEHLYRYIHTIDPEFIDIENVVEFMSWGPLRVACEKIHADRCDLKVRANGSFHMVPFSKKNGKYYHHWHQTICKEYGYEYDYRILNSADFGALTSRTRFFGQFKKPTLPFTWPVPTHAKNPEKVGMFGGLNPWKAVKPALDLEDEGKSIFGRKKDLSENTLKRIYAGLVKYVGEGKEPEFIMKYLSNNSKTGISNPVDIDSVAPTVTTQNRLAFVKAEFIMKYFSGRPIVNSQFISKYYGNGDNVGSINEPSGTITTKDRMAMINVVWLDKQFRSDANHQSIDRPAGSILTNDKHCKISVTWLFNHNYSNTGSQIEMPCPTILASRKHYYLADAEKGNGVIVIYSDDSKIMQKIKLFMAYHGIIDIKMRMLKVPELLRIQGFGDGYILKGNQTDQKRFIGNAVEVNLAKHKVKARIGVLTNLVRKEAVA